MPVKRTSAGNSWYCCGRRARKATIWARVISVPLTVATTVSGEGASCALAGRARPRASTAGRRRVLRGIRFPLLAPLRRAALTLYLRALTSLQDEGPPSEALLWRAGGASKRIAPHDPVTAQTRQATCLELAALRKRSFGTTNDRKIKAVRPTVDKINALRAGVRGAGRCWPDSEDPGAEGACCRWRKP